MIKQEDEQQNLIRHAVAAVQKGMSVDPESICSSLKSKGLSFEERVQFFQDLYDAPIPIVRERIWHQEEEYRNNPEIERQYKRKFKLSDFIPGAGYFLNQQRNQPLKEANHLFYYWANRDFASSIKLKAFNLYHFMSCGCIGAGIIDLLTK